jgi:hypothetical protein
LEIFKIGILEVSDLHTPYASGYLSGYFIHGVVSMGDEIGWQQEALVLCAVFWDSRACCIKMEA